MEVKAQQQTYKKRVKSFTTLSMPVEKKDETSLFRNSFLNNKIVNDVVRHGY